MSIARTLRTVRHLKPVQVGNRVWRKLRRPSPRLGPPPPVRQIGPITQPCGRSESLLRERQVRLLGITRDIERSSDWNRDEWPKLWLYGLHYHDGLRAEATDTALKRAFVERWMAENPPLVGNGWEPYPLSLRIVNWIYWLANQERPDPSILTSLAVQVRALEGLLEYHLLGNHLWANGKALIFAGLFFDGPEAAHWYAKGQRIAEAQRREQFLDDGGHFELSPSYHQLMLEDVLDIINLSAVAGRPLSADWYATAERALDWLHIMTRPDGSIPLFNDAFEDVAPPTSELNDYALRLGIAAVPPPKRGLTYLAASGYARWNGNDFIVWADVGRLGPDYIPGHAHADCLGFELFAGGMPLIVDTGVSTYDRVPRREYERGTMAHNSVAIAGADQAELWASFRVGRRPNIHNVAVDAAAVAAEHDGYDRLGVRHRRRFDFADRSVIISDRLARRRSGPPATARFHFAPGTQVTIDGEHVRAGPLEIRIDGATELRLEPCEISRRFGDKEASLRLAADFDAALVTRIAFPAPLA